MRRLDPCPADLVLHACALLPTAGGAHAARPTTTQKATRPPRALLPLDELAVAAQSGERRAQQALLVALRPAVLRAVRAVAQSRYLGRLSTSDHEDVTQEVMMLVMARDLGRYDASQAGFMTFVSRRVLWSVGDAVRGGRRFRADSLDDGAAAHLQDAGGDPELRLAEAAWADACRAVRGDLARALKGDPDVRAAQAVQSYDLDGCGIKATAERLGVHVSNASRARQRGLQRAREVLAREPRYAALAA